LLLSLISAASIAAQVNTQYSYHEIKNAIISYSNHLESGIKNFGSKLKGSTGRIETDASNEALNASARKTLGAYSTGDAAVDAYIIDSCQRYNIDPLLIYAQMYQESRFKPRAMSHKGATGLMQLIPATAVRFGVKDIRDPKQNIEGGVKYMRWLLNRFDGNLHLALAAYNAGENSVKRFNNQIPPYQETQKYVAKITTHYSQIAGSNVESWR
jgi:soluble lytic murein transglycosylase-like protein